MKWYSTLSSSICASVIIALVGLVSLTSFHVCNAENKVPLDQVEEWMIHIIALIPLSLIFMIISGGFMWIILSNDRIRLFTALLVLNFLLLAICVYFTVTFATEMDAAPPSAEILFDKVQSIIAKKVGNGTTKLGGPSGQEKVANKAGFIPPWLDSIQKHSKVCCGINTFRDWEEFWPETPTLLPKSCCKDPNSEKTCVTDMMKIPFPGTPTMFIKTETGCLEEINKNAIKGITQSFIYLVIMCALFGLSEIIYIIQFYNQYIPSSGSVLSGFSGTKGIDDGTGDGTADGGDNGGGMDDNGSFLQLSATGSGYTDTSTIGSLDNSVMLPPNNQSLSFSVTMDGFNQSGGGTGIRIPLRNTSSAGKLPKRIPGLGGGGGGSIGGSQIVIPPIGINNYNQALNSGNVSGIGSNASLDSGTEPDYDNPKSSLKKKKRKSKRREDIINSLDLDDGNDGTIQPDMSPAFIAVANLGQTSPPEGSSSPTPVFSNDDVGDILAPEMRPTNQNQQNPINDKANLKNVFGMNRTRKK